MDLTKYRVTLPSSSLQGALIDSASEIGPLGGPRAAVAVSFGRAREEHHTKKGMPSPVVPPRRSWSAPENPETTLKDFGAHPGTGDLLSPGILETPPQKGKKDGVAFWGEGGGGGTYHVHTCHLPTYLLPLTTYYLPRVYLLYYHAAQ